MYHESERSRAGHLRSDPFESAARMVLLASVEPSAPKWNERVAGEASTRPTAAEWWSLHVHE